MTPRSERRTIANRAARIDAVSVGLCLLAAFASSASAQVLDRRFPTTDQTIEAQLLVGDTLFIGGRFTAVATVPTGSLASFRVGIDQPDPSWPDVDGQVYSAAPDGEGGWYLGGAFSHVSGVPRQCAAHVRADGTLDGWNPSPNEYVYAVAKVGDTVYLGGRFWSVGGQNRYNLAAVNATTGAVLPWLAGMTGNVTQLLVMDSTLFVGGRFSHAGNEPRSSLAAFDLRTGSLRPWNLDVLTNFGGSFNSGEVYALEVLDSTVYVGGFFHQLAGQPRFHGGAFNGHTGAVLPWAPATNGPISCIAPTQSTIYVGGWFPLGSPDQYDFLLALNASDGSLLPWNPHPDDWVISLMMHSGVLYAGGRFRSIGGALRQHLAAIDPVTATSHDWDPGPNSQVSLIVAKGDTVLASGEFDAVGARPRARLAAIDLRTTQLLPWNPGANDVVTSLHARGGVLYVGGGFTRLGNEARDRVGALNVETGAVLPWNPGANSDVLAISTDEDDVYLGGLFTSVAGQERQHLAAVRAASGELLSWNPAPNGSVDAFAVTDSAIFVGGRFQTVDGESTSTLAVFDRLSGARRSENFQLDERIRTLLFDGTSVFVGGDFTQIAEQGRNRLAAFDPTGSQLLPWNPGATGEVFALSQESGTLYVGGAFGGLGGQPRSCLGAVDAVTGEPTPWAPPYLNLLYSVAAREGVVYVSGDFSSVGGPSYPRLGHLAKFIPADAGVPLNIEVLGPQPGAMLETGSIVEFHWEVSGGVVLSQSADVLLSRNGPGGPWELLAAGVTARQFYRWHVTVPTSQGLVYVRVVARDAFGVASSSLAAGPFTIVEPTVPTLIDLFRAEPTAQGVRVEWRLSEPREFANVSPERGAEAAGEFVVVAGEQVDENGATHILDRDVEPGRTWWYRLAGTRIDGSAFATGPLAVALAGEASEYTLSPLAPNPTRGRATLSYTLPRRSHVRLTVSDIQGRDLAVLADGERGAGQYGATLDASDLRPGLYFIRLRAPGVDLRRRVTIVR